MATLILVRRRQTAAAAPSPGHGQYCSSVEHYQRRKGGTSGKTPLPFYFIFFACVVCFVKQKVNLATFRRTGRAER